MTYDLNVSHVNAPEKSIIKDMITDFIVIYSLPHTVRLTLTVPLL